MENNDKYELLRNINKSRHKNAMQIGSIIEFTVPSYTLQNIINKFEWSNLIKWDTKNDIVSLTKKGKLFILWYPINSILHEITGFLKNLFWIIAFIISILANIYYIIKSI